ncbi:AIG2-like family protein [Roseibium album]|nr:AIG2-like family protein [Roseibium album]
MSQSANNPFVRLATYGTLSPGRPNHVQVAEIQGAWSTGVVRGRLMEIGWGTALGFPGFFPDPDGDEVTVHLITSVELKNHWQRLDDFEGIEYRRTTIMVETPGGSVAASIYVAETEPDKTT